MSAGGNLGKLWRIWSNPKNEFPIKIKRLLHEISLYSPGTKHSVDIRRLDLEREIIGLRKELRISKLSLWKDLVFLRRELREMVFEYQALKRMADLVENGGKNDVAG
jgi:hypothetical protein